jgi:OmpA-OmpF porin, OOP family
MIGKIIGTVISFTAIATQLSAQGIGIELSGGLQGTQYQLQNGQTKPLPGGSLGLNYTFRLGSHLGLLTGISGGIYRTQASLQDGVVYSSAQVDDAGSAFQYKMKTEGYKETQQFFAAGVPLLLQYHTVGPGTQWYFDVGGKIFVPFNTSIQISAQKLILSGYYPDFNVDVSNLPQHGFGTVDNWKANATTKMKPAATLSAATGLSFNLSPGTRLYTGIYIDYGITDLKEKNDSMPLATYSSKGISGAQVSSLLNTPNSGLVGLLSFGVQVRLSFGSANPKPTRTANKKEPQQTLDSTIRMSDARIIQSPVVFGLIGETTVQDREKAHLDIVADIMKKHPDIRISIEGHSCNDKTETESIKTGSSRANAVARYLRDKGIDRSRMDVSYANERDAATQLDPSGYQNRRVVITIL